MTGLYTVCTQLCMLILTSPRRKSGAVVSVFCVFTSLVRYYVEIDYMCHYYVVTANVVVASATHMNVDAFV